MKREIALLILLLSLALVATGVFAASGGGGGGGGGSSGGGGGGGTGTVVIPRQNITPDKPTEFPAEEGTVKEYKCSSHSTRSERIRCRIKLEEENEYNYIPEECRAQSGTERSKCMTAYKSVEKCWEFEKDQRRFECARNEFALRNIADERAECEALGDNKSACLRNLREKIDRAVKFRIYKLEEKAEHLMDKGKVNETELVELVEQLEQKKLDYNKAKTKEAKKIVLQDVRELWQAFVSKTKEKVGKRAE